MAMPPGDVSSPEGDVATVGGDADTTGERCGQHRRMMWTAPEGDVDSTGGDLAMPECDLAGTGG